MSFGSFKNVIKCDTMSPLCWVCVCVYVCVYAGQTISLSVLARNPNKGIELEISRETGAVRGEEGPREDRGSVGEGRRRETVDISRQKEAGEDGSRAEKGVNRSQKATAKT